MKVRQKKLAKICRNYEIFLLKVPFVKLKTTVKNYHEQGLHQLKLKFLPAISTNFDDNFQSTMLRVISPIMNIRQKWPSGHMWLMSQRNPCEMQQCCQCTFLKHFSITKHILAKKKFFIIAIFLKWRFLFYLVNQRMKKICFYCSRGFVCCLGKNL